MSSLKIFITEWVGDFFKYLRILLSYFVAHHLKPRFSAFESVKSILVGKLYQQRGKHAQLIVNSVMVTVMVLSVTLGPSIVVNDSQTQAVMSLGLGNKFAFAQESSGSAETARILGLSTDSQIEMDPLTQVSDKPRADILDYTVENGDTLASIAKKFGVDTDSIKWLNKELNEKKLKLGSILKIPPVTGVVHTVKSGETIYSIAKKYNVSAQAVVDFPFNEFTNDETFAIAIGQKLIVPDGEMPDEPILSPRSNLAGLLTPNAGAVSATGNWIWPAAGSISQGFKSWHKGIDIANRGGGTILAADSGKVLVASWLDNTGYGNRVVIDHGNGIKTLYAHMSSFSVVVGQTVKRGDKLGMMGSTGRSTGTHLHFEIRSDKGNANPLSQLK
ncbi:MAG: Peptidase M23 family protein [Candidatus Collierbacteria bacterium GW2011_GWC2_44_18]|uniref:Peptidase M23 family protein n=1 Tax=Candidatus Collierbacteria bacterium GW2011_GWC2_44_18 TaxID=1618392 RepID=A0A0G1HMC7_9BACT|nr:MAG: peptidase M23 [Microgenomates group bacterium GW2011_GWC1_44_10]KKT48351.1 MAG: Peptidase M23 family protein [Candidatus Collierbacteria bacterium GW2011_GWC2_44_18]